jgi:hypothetical protein
MEIYHIILDKHKYGKVDWCISFFSMVIGEAFCSAHYPPIGSLPAAGLIL